MSEYGPILDSNNPMSLNGGSSDGGTAMAPSVTKTLAMFPRCHDMFPQSCTKGWDWQIVWVISLSECLSIYIYNNYDFIITWL